MKSSEAALPEDEVFLSSFKEQEELMERHVKWEIRAIKATTAILAPVVVFGSLCVAQYLTSHKTEQANIEAKALRQLPEAVKRYLGSIGQVFNLTYDKEQYAENGLPLVDSSYVGSGIALNEHEVLTAGHMLNTGTSKPYLNLSTECSNILFDAGMYGSYGLVEGSSYKFGDSTAVPDIGLIFTGNPNWRHKDDHNLPAVSFASRAPVPGQPLYFVNYEPINSSFNSAERSPTSTGPAIYGGIYVGNEPNGDYDVLTGFKSYGKVYAVNSWGGSSGGPVFNANSQAVGIMVESATSLSTLASYESEFGVTIEGVPGSRMVSESIIQPLNQNTVNSIVDTVQAVPNCID